MTSQNYAKTYCELEARIMADETALKNYRRVLQDLERAGQGDSDEAVGLRSKVEIFKKMVDYENRNFSTLRSDLKKLSEEFDDVELKVFVLHYIKGYNLKKVAKRLFFSHIRVKQIHQTIRAKIEEPEA